MKKGLLLVLIFAGLVGKAQRIDSIYVNLYTDSLKKGTYNYINVDGLLSNGNYIPLDSTKLLFTSSHGKFFGNSLWIDRDISCQKVAIQITLKSDIKQQKNFVMFIKTKEEEHLKTEKQLLGEMKQKRMSEKNHTN